MTSEQSEPNELVIREQGSALRITLNRPHALNALSFAMVQQLREVLSRSDSAGYSCIILDGTGERGFCGGGDVKQLSQMADSDARQFLSVEYEADLLSHTVQTPVVSIMSGITMGGGIGIGGHVRHRVVTETSRLAMPEARIGLTPDVGGSLLLARAPGHLGEYLATSGSSMTAGDALALGFADAYVAQSEVLNLVHALCGGTTPEDALTDYASAAPQSVLLEQQGWVDECFSRESVVDAMEALREHPEPGAREAWRVLSGNSPIAVATSFWSVRRARQNPDLPTVLKRELHAMSTLMGTFDGREGVRALLIDKDMAPRWKHERVSDVTVAQLEEVLGAEVRPLLTKNRV